MTYTAPENPNMSTARWGTIRADQYSALGHRTVGIQEPVGYRGMVLRNDAQQAFASVFLDQLDVLGADVREHHRRLTARQAAGSQNEI